MDHVDSVEVVGVFCNSHNTLIRSFDYFKSKPIPSPPRPLSNPQRALSKSTPLVLKAEKVRVKKNLLQPGRNTKLRLHKNHKTLSLLILAVFVYLACAFRYGSDDLDVMGLSFRRDIWIQRVQVYPPTGEAPKSEMVDFLMKKVGEQGQAFSFQVPQRRQPHFFLPCGSHSLSY